MFRQQLSKLALIGAVGWCGACRPAPAQAVRGSAPTGPAIEISAEELGKQFAPDTLGPEKTYEGKVLRVSGKVSMAYEPFIYLGTGSNFPTGQPVKVTLDYNAAKMPEVAVGDRVVVEGRFDRKGIFGPILTQCRVVRREQEGKATPADLFAPPAAPVAVARKGRIAKKAADAGAPATTTDPHAFALRFDGPVRQGEPGYRAECTSFRLRFGPGKWRGTAVGKSIAWGVGNQNQDFWGAGSGEATYSSEVHEDAQGAYFVFSLNGTDWESDRVAALFRLTLPDGSFGIATALVPVENGP